MQARPLSDGASLRLHEIETRLNILDPERAPEVIDGVEWLVDLVHEHVLAPPGTPPDDDHEVLVHRARRLLGAMHQASPGSLVALRHDALELLRRFRAHLQDSS